MSRSTTSAQGVTQFRVDDQLFDWMVEIRRHIHQHPELSFQEFETAAYIKEKLKEQGLTFQGGVGKTGIICSLGDSTSPAQTVGLRADMDGLPVTEKTGLPFTSQKTGIMHACGHDGHVAMLLGAAVLLNNCKNLPGRVKLIFQPAEENGNGAARLVDEGICDDVGAIFAGHIDTHYQTGEITVDDGIICAFSDPFTIRLSGKGGHAARPHEATDAVVAASSLVMMVQQLISRGVDPNKAEVITIGSFQAGTAPNVIAGEAELRGTIRSTDSEIRLQTMHGLRRIVSSIATMHDVNAELIFDEGLPAVINSKDTADAARAAAYQVTSIDKVISQGFPSLGGEDFAFYQKVTEGCLVRFGASLEGEAGPAHSDRFDFDEACMRIGAHWLAAVAVEWLKRSEARVRIPG